MIHFCECYNNQFLAEKYDFLFYSQQYCPEEGECDCHWSVECLRIYQFGRAQCDWKDSFCPDTLPTTNPTKSTVAKCGGCIVQCPIEQYGPNPPKTTYHCCRCPPPPRTPPTPPPKGKCFPSTAKVSLENGKYVTMSELRTEDKVQTGIHLVYSLFHYFFKNIIF